MTLKCGFLLCFLLCVAAVGAPEAPEAQLPPANAAEPSQAELSLGEIVLGLSTDRSVYSPREPVMVELGIGNTSDHEVTLNTLVILVTGGEGQRLPTAGMKWLPGEVRILTRRGSRLWTSGAYTSSRRAIRQKTFPEQSSMWFEFVWPQFRAAREIVHPGEYAVEAKFFVLKEEWEGGYPVLRLPITISKDPIHPSFEVEKEGLTWRVDLDREESQPGQGVRLKLTVANISKEPVIIWWSQQFVDSHFVIYDSQGQEVWTNRIEEEEEAFVPRWPTPPITFPPGECKLVAQGHWDGRIEVGEEGAEEDTEEKERVDAPPGEYTLKTVRGFPSMPIFEELQFSLVAP